MSTNRKIAKASAILMSASIAGHALSMLKEVLVANYFGITRAMDAFYSALTITNWITPIFLSAFILIGTPIFAKYRLSDRDEANRLASTLMNAVLAALVVIAAVVFIFSEGIIRLAFKGLSAETAVLSARLLRILAATVVFGGAATMFTTLLNVNEDFLWPSVSTMFVTLVTIALMVFFAARWGVFVFAWGLFAGLAAQCFFLYPLLAKYGYKHRFAIEWRHPEIKKTLNHFAALTALAVISGLNTVINRIMAAWLPSGSIAALAYADKLVQVPLIIFSGSVTTAIYPFFSTQIADNRTEEMKDTLALGLRMGAFIFLPLSAVMIVLAGPLVGAMFQRGAFDASATALTSSIFACYALQLFSGYAVAIMQRMVFAFRDVAAVVRTTIIGVVLTVGLNSLFIKIINPPAAGIALASSLVLTVVAVCYFIILKKRMKNLHGMSVVRAVVRIALLAAASGFLARAVYSRMAPAYFSTGSLPALLFAIAVSGIAAVGFYIFTAGFLFKFEEARKVFSLIKIKTGDAAGKSDI